MIHRGGKTVDRLSLLWPVITQDNASAAKSTGGVRLVGPEARMSKREREEGKSKTAAAIVAGKPELNHRAITQLLLLPF